MLDSNAKEQASAIACLNDLQEVTGLLGDSIEAQKAIERFHLGVFPEKAIAMGESLKNDIPRTHQETVLEEGFGNVLNRKISTLREMLFELKERQNKTIHSFGFKPNEAISLNQEVQERGN